MTPIRAANWRRRYRGRVARALSVADEQVHWPEEAALAFDPMNHAANSRFCFALMVAQNVKLIERDARGRCLGACPRRSRWDAKEKKVFGFTAAFGWRQRGHANRRVVRADKQMAKLLLRLGEVHPPR